MDEGTSDAEESLEPKLKYERIGGDLTNIFSKDTLSCLTVHSKFIALGTSWGIIHIVDHLGNSISVKELSMHSSTVNQISIDMNGDYIASCSHDGRVIVSGLYNTEHNYMQRFDIEVKSIALNPNFGKPSVSKLFVVGLDKVIMFEKTIFGRKSNIIYQGGYGVIETLKWHNNFISWADQKAVKVYDVATSSVIGTVNRELWGAAVLGGGTLPATTTTCHVTWYPGVGTASEDLNSFEPKKTPKIDTWLLTGWADSLKVCQIACTTPNPKSALETATPRSSLVLPGSPLSLLGDLGGSSPVQVKYLQIVYSFRTHFYVCGLVPYPDVNTIAILAYVMDEDADVKTFHPPDGSNRCTAVEAVEAADIQPETRSRSRNSTTVSYRPQLHVITPHVDYYEESVNDALSTKDWATTQPSEYHLDGLPSERFLFVGSPKDVVIGRNRSGSDHVDWLLQRNMFEAALKYATSASAPPDLPPSTVHTIARAYVDHLLSRSLYESAASQVTTWYDIHAPSGSFRSVDQSNADADGPVYQVTRLKGMWTDAVYKFAKARKLHLLLGDRSDGAANEHLGSHFLPLGGIGQVELEPACYHLVLAELVAGEQPEASDPYKKFLEVVSAWPSRLYNVPLVINMAFDRLSQDTHNCTLQQGLALLYTYDGKYAKALAIYMRLGLEHAFDLIVERELFPDVKDKVSALLALNREKTLALLVDHRSKIPISHIVQQLEDRPVTLLEYLDRLFEKDGHFGKMYHGMQVNLYAQHLPSKLMPFLKSSQHYPLQKALEECQAHSLFHETVYLYIRMGNSKQALKVMVDSLGDIEGAINYCKEQDDPELWNELILLSVDDPDFITILLQNIGTYVDPIILIKQIKPTMKIGGLRDSLVKILRDYHLQIALREDCNKILLADVDLLFRNKYKAKTRSLTLGTWPYPSADGRSTMMNAKCASCQQELFSRPNYIPNKIKETSSTQPQPKSLSKASKPSSDDLTKSDPRSPALTGDHRQLSDLVFYHCNHVFHSDCVQPSDPSDSSNKISCPVCSSVSESLSFTTN